MIDFKRGSTWNKWDLHVHTPDSHTTHYRSSTGTTSWQNFISDMEKLPEEIKAVGINDYFFIEGYTEVKRLKQSGRLQNLPLILPVIELRLKMFAGHNVLKKINYHVIFSDELSPEDIQMNFLNRLDIKYESNNGTWQRSLNRNNLTEFGKILRSDLPEDQKDIYGGDFEAGAANVTFDLNQIHQLLEQPIFIDKALTAIGKAEWYSFNWSQAAADKRSLIKNADMIFTASPTVEKCAESIASLKEQGVNYNLLHCSDAHFHQDSKEINRLGNCFTWVKANLTFQGLQYALKEYDQRVFIGDEPDKIKMLKLNPHRFLNRITIKKNSTSTLTEKWFDHDIVLNHDLVAIVGNKGSGKSALADILGLVGNTSRGSYFSFLNSNRFMDPKHKKASHYTAQGTWHSGSDLPKLLDQLPDNFDQELIQYLPQSYIEKVCNEVNLTNKDSEFDKQIKTVIFSHISVADRLGTYSFDELVAFKTTETNDRITKLKGNLSRLNSEIAELETRSTLEEIERIKKNIEQKYLELSSHESIRPTTPVMPPPETDDVAAIELLDKKVKNSEELNKNIIFCDSKKIRIALDIDKIVKTIDRTKNTEKFVETFKSEMQDDFQILGLDMDDVIKTSFNYTKLQDKLQSLKIEHQENDKTQQSTVEFKRIEDLEIVEIKKNLAAPNQAYQKDVQNLKQWEEKKSKIIGSEEIVDSLEYLKKRLLQIESTTQLEKLKLRRFEIVKDINREIHSLGNVFVSLFTPAKTYIDNESQSLPNFNFEFSLNYSTSNFGELLSEWINSRVLGPFSGIDGKKEIQNIINETDFSTELNVIEFLKIINLKLNTVNPNFPMRHPVTQQLRTTKKLSDFYDFIFSLDYLRPKYTLKSGGIEISKLSPGQKGLLLLYFFLMVEKSDLPLIIDQPEENLDNHTIFEYLVPCIQSAKRRRQIFIVTHNPNLAVVCDADQIIWCHLSTEDNFSINYHCGAIEDPSINLKVVNVLEGTHRAFEKRKSKYMKN